jgi:hypothetical protein
MIRLRTNNKLIFLVARPRSSPCKVVINLRPLPFGWAVCLGATGWTGGVKLAFCCKSSSSSRRWRSIDRTATKNVCTRNQWATSTTTANAQNWRVAPCAKKAMTPRMILYVRTFSELEVPARDKPSAIRSLTGRVIDVLTTAST